MPRWLAYQALRVLGSRARRKMPPMPVARVMITSVRLTMSIRSRAAGESFRFFRVRSAVNLRIRSRRGAGGGIMASRMPMPDVSSRLNWLTRLIGVSGLLCVLALQLMHVGRVTSATWDEAHHLFDGYTIWKLHDYTLNPEVPPLVKLTAAVLLVRLPPDGPLDQGDAVPREAFPG